MVESSYGEEAVELVLYGSLICLVLIIIIPRVGFEYDSHLFWVAKEEEAAVCSSSFWWEEVLVFLRLAWMCRKVRTLHSFPSLFFWVQEVVVVRYDFWTVLLLYEGIFLFSVLY